MEVNLQTVYLWIKNGAMPLENVGKISRILSEPVYGFSYEPLVDLLSGGPSWEEVLTYYGLSEAALQWILEVEAPVTEFAQVYDGAQAYAEEQAANTQN